jgi:hypothetical protein
MVNLFNLELKNVDLVTPPFLGVTRGDHVSWNTMENMIHVEFQCLAHEDVVYFNLACT